MRFVPVMFLIMILAGCASSGQPLSRKAATQVQQGITTQEDLYRLFGPSMHTARDEHGRTILSWGYSRLGATEGFAVVMSDEGKAIGYHLMAGPSPTAMRTIIRRDARPPAEYRASSDEGGRIRPSSYAIPPPAMFVTANNLNVRDAPVSGAIIKKLARGTRVRVFASSGGWARVSEEGSSPEEWVSRGYLCTGAACWVAAPSQINTLPSSPSPRGYSGGGCSCSSSSNCYGPRGGRYCITSGGNKRYR